MEVERSSEYESTLSLRWNGDALSPEATMTCLILASCSCERVPALIFMRPFSSRRRWNEYGEIFLADPPSADLIPQWPLKMMTNATRSSFHGRNELGEYKRESLVNWKLSPSIENLCGQSVIGIQRDGDDFFFQMPSNLREDIWTQTSTQDRLLVWFDLVRLVIYSSPEAYAELFWRNTFLKCKAVIDSTILPFLSVLEWAHLVGRQTLISPLLSFLLHYSIFNGFDVDTCLHLEPALLQSIRSCANPKMRRTIEILEFKELLCLHLIYPQKQQWKSPDLFLRESIETVELHGVFGFLLASISESSQASQNTSEILAIVHKWRKMRLRVPSSIVAFAESLLFVSELFDANWKPLRVLGNADMQMGCTMATAMLERNHFTEACILLTECQNYFKPTERDYVDWYLPVMTELVKCRNILNQEQHGEETALEALRYRYPDTATQNEIGNMQIALVDSLIGQSRYLEAEKLLEEVLAGGVLSDYLIAVTSLRLSKVRRRLGVSNVLAFTHNGVPLKALMDASNSNSLIRDQFLEELSSTVNFIRQRITRTTPEVQALINTASILTAGQAISTSSWRTRILQKQVALISGVQTGDEQNDHRNTAWRSVYAKASQKIPPLRVLVLREEQYSNELQLDLDSLHRHLNVEGHHDVALTTIHMRQELIGTLDSSFELVFLEIMAIKSPFPNRGLVPKIKRRSHIDHVASILSGQGFTGPDTSNLTEKPCWAVFHRSIGLCGPEIIPIGMFLDEIEQYLILHRRGQDRNFGPFMLQRLGNTRLHYNIGRSSAMVEGTSQDNIPTDMMKEKLSGNHGSGSLVGSTQLPISGKIMFPNCKSADLHMHEGLPASSITPGRVIEDLDHPAGTYYDSKAASILEAGLWGVNSCWHSMRLLERIPLLVRLAEKGGQWEVWRLMTFEGIKTYRSILSIKEAVPEFPRASQKRDLMEWISQRRVAGRDAFIITAYQTYANTTIQEQEYTPTAQGLLERLHLKSFRSDESSTVGSFESNVRLSEKKGDKAMIEELRRCRRRMHLPGERVAAICVREVKVVQSFNGQDDLSYGKEFWRVYWGLVDKEPDSQRLLAPTSTYGDSDEMI